MSSASTIFFIIICFHFSHAILIPNVTVDIKGSGNYSTVKAAVENAPIKSMFRYVIHIKQGNYTEYVHIPLEKWNITIFGDGKEKTILSSNRSNRTGFGIDVSAALRIDGSGFVAMNLTVENTAGPIGLQTVALYSNSNYSAFYNLEIIGSQDSLHVNEGPQFFSECSIYGTVDFIFGEGHAVFQKCQIFARNETLEGKKNVIAANGCRRPVGCGFSFHLCNITGDRKLLQSKFPTQTFLGRPWKAYSLTVIMESEIAHVIDSKGWLDYRNISFQKTVFFGEYKNTGEGAAVNNRVRWIGVHSSLSKKRAKKFTVGRFIRGDKWLPQLGIQYVAGLRS